MAESGPNQEASRISQDGEKTTDAVNFGFEDSATMAAETDPPALKQSSDGLREVPPVLSHSSKAHIEETVSNATCEKHKHFGDDGGGDGESALTDRLGGLSVGGECEEDSDGSYHSLSGDEEAEEELARDVENEQLFTDASSEDVGEKLAEDVVSEACGQTDDNKDDEDEKDQEEDESVRQKEEETLSEEEKEDRKQRGQKLKEEGNQLFRQASYAEAITCYTQALEICPLTYQKDRAIMFSNRAACRMKEEKYETAIKDCSKAIDLHPHYLKAVLRRAELYEKTEKLDDAMKDHQKVLELDPSQHASRAACLRLDEEIKERNEKLKNEMIGKLKDLGNMVLRPFGLSTNNFKLQQDPSTGGYSVQFCQDPPTNGN
ncbi:hypothetical protein BaRGS_00035289 [Batillaria attramentaria]|uniref:Tetratricopeptide repeat protein 1 n=1 Tax=Batillaria attramentaria TaxID=370345 RepID=A0ABD0JF07_9CAEN